LLLRRIVGQFFTRRAARVGTVAARQQDPAVRGGHDARRSAQPLLIDHHRLRQKRLNQMAGQSPQRRQAELFDACAR